MDILIVDDESLARARLVKLLENYPACDEVREAANADEARSQILTSAPDIILLDIHMPGDSGIVLAEWISELEDSPAVIFCTAHDRHALEAFSVNASDYLLKPINRDKLFASIEAAASLNRAQSAKLAGQGKKGARKKLTVKNHQGVELISLDDVLFFMADKKYVSVYHKLGVELIDEPLKDLESEFSERFVRVHRNTLVAVDAIVAMEKTDDGQYVLRLNGTDHSPAVSRRHSSQIKKLISRL